MPGTVPPAGRLEAFVVVAVALIALGGLAWLWLGEWRWALTGLVAAVVTAVAGATGGTKPPAT
jgi:NhaP-type Na+/H+ or K+/H+ antiporter